MCDEQVGFTPRHCTPLQLARLFKRITMNFGVKTLTDAIFLDVAKAFDNVCFDELLCKLSLLKFASYIVHTISFNLKDRTLETSFQTPTSSRRSMWGGVAQGGFLSPGLFNLYVNDIPPHSPHIELTLYADDTAIIATSRKPTLIFSYLESYPNDLQCWLYEWRIAINISKNTAIIRTCRTALYPARIRNSLRRTNRIRRHY